MSNKRNLPTELNKQAFLPQSLKAGSGEAEAPTESETFDSKQPYQQPFFVPPKGLSSKPQFAPSPQDDPSVEEEKDYVAALPTAAPKAVVPPQF